MIGKFAYDCVIAVGIVIMLFIMGIVMIGVFVASIIYSVICCVAWLWKMAKIRGTEIQTGQHHVPLYIVIEPARVIKPYVLQDVKRVSADRMRQMGLRS